MTDLYDETNAPESFLHSRESLRAFFQSGQKPSEAQLSSLINSLFHKDDGLEKIKVGSTVKDLLKAQLDNGDSQIADTLTAEEVFTRILIQLGRKPRMFTHINFAKVSELEVGQRVVIPGWGATYDVFPANSFTSDLVGSREGVTFHNCTVEPYYQLSLVDDKISPLSALVTGAPLNGIDDDTAFLQNGLLTGRNVILPACTFVLTDELLMIHAHQELLGQGAGTIIGTKEAVGWRTRCLVPLGVTIPPYVKTRRAQRASASDANDDPISCLINIENEGCTVDGIFFELECDYTDNSPTNLGADCDVAIFNGCRGGVQLGKWTVLGYFRKAALYNDVTRSITMPEFTSPSGIEYPMTGTNGGDQVHTGQLRSTGALKSVFVAGPYINEEGIYYDSVSGQVYDDDRGGSGCSDFTFGEQSYLESREHHSGYRAHDPLMNPNLEDLDKIAAPVVIDAVRGSTSQGRARRFYASNIRLRTIEGARFFFGRCYEFFGLWIHTEPKSGTVYDTQGNVISVGDYDNHSYGSVAAVKTEGSNIGADEIHFAGIWGTSPKGKWSSDQIENFSWTRTLMNPSFSATFDSDLTVGDDLTVADALKASSLALTSAATPWTPYFLFIAEAGINYIQQVGKITQIADIVFCDFLIEFDSLNTADGSAVVIGGLPENLNSQSTTDGSIDLAMSTALNLSVGDSIRLSNNGTVSQISLTDISGVTHKYNDGRINTSGVIKGSMMYRV